jgi:LL-diaminopimelate aminotransferase
MPKIAKRLSSLPTYVFVQIGANIQKLQANGADIIRLDIGNPDMQPDSSVIEALNVASMSPDNHGYSGYRGIPSYREAVARFYKKRFGVDLDPETEVLPLIGTKEGIVNLTMAYIDQGDVSLVPSLGYPSYAMATRLAGGDVVYMPMDDQYMLDVSGLDADTLERANLLWVNYPNNPTGAIATHEDYQTLLDLCKANDILLASDNPYVDITFDGYVAPSVLELPNAKDHAIEFFSFSKTFNMAGWRIGAAVGNAEALKYLLKVKSNVDSGHFKAIYHAASVALDVVSADWLNNLNAIYQKRRDKILSALDGIGLQANCPPASLYIWARIPESFGDDDVKFVNQVLEEAHVSLAPGSAYGPLGNGFIRMSVSIEDNRLDEALARLTHWYANL